MSENCKKLHELFNSMQRFNFPFNDNDLPLNGVYILFEKGEIGHGKNRIVRIGTHTGENQLKSRIKQHFIDENKDRSIFRKNIGRALLNKRYDLFLEDWEKDLTTKEARDKFQEKIDLGKQKLVEGEVTNHLQNNLSFIVFPIENKDERLKIESKIISEISLCKACGPSENWIGNHSPKDKIKRSGLWQVNELYKEPFTKKELEEFEKILQDRKS
jgi:hypothetical protein